MTATSAWAIDPAKPPLDDMDLVYGCWVTSVGEDGGLLIAGHVPLMRAVAVMNRYSRNVIGLSNMADDRGCSLADIAAAVQHRWARSLTLEDCPDRAQQLAAGETHYCEMCNTIEGGDWWIHVYREERPDAFPVTWYEP